MKKVLDFPLLSTKVPRFSHRYQQTNIQVINNYSDECTLILITVHTKLKHIVKYNNFINKKN